MLNKFLISILLGATMSFATWGYFPLKDSDAGLTVKATHFYISGDSSHSSLDLSARYVFSHTLELSLMNFGYQFSNPSGMENPVLGTRLQLGKRTLLFAEVTLPFGNDDMDKYVHVGLQQALVLAKHFAWSFELGYQDYFEKTIDGGNSDKASICNFAWEMDFNVKPSFIWFIGERASVNVSKRPSSSDSNGDSYDHYYGYEYENEEEKIGDHLDASGFAGFNLKLAKNTFLEEELGISVSYSNTTKTSSDPNHFFKTSLKHHF